jgi:hypothetical protein
MNVASSWLSSFHHTLTLFLLCAFLAFIHLHHTGSPEGITLLEFETKEGGVPPEVQPEEPEEEGAVAEFPECSEHQPSTFLKGKPQTL